MKRILDRSLGLVVVFITGMAVTMVGGCGGGSQSGTDDRSNHHKSGGEGGGAQSETSSTGSGPSGVPCCLPTGNYDCPTKEALNQCIGFDPECALSCASTDGACFAECANQVANAVQDPSACTPNPQAKCNGTSAGPSTSSSSGAPSCSPVTTPCQFDADCCSQNCAGGTCWGTTPGNPCEFDADCNSQNCVDGVCA